MVTGRMACVVSANGAPDCKAGAEQAVPEQGLQGRQEPRYRFRREVLAKVFIPGRKREPGDCKTENFVTKALCQ